MSDWPSGMPCARPLWTTFSTISRSANPSITITSPMRRFAPVRWDGGVSPDTGNGPAEAAWVSLMPAISAGGRARLKVRLGAGTAACAALSVSGQTWSVSTMSVISNTRRSGPAGHTTAKPLRRRVSRRWALMRSASPVESMKPTWDRSMTTERTASITVSFRTLISRGAVAMSSSPSTSKTSTPSVDVVRSTASGCIGRASLHRVRLRRAGR